MRAGAWEPANVVLSWQPLIAKGGTGIIIFGIRLIQQGIDCLNITRYYFTLKHLKPIQLFGRLRFRLFSPKPSFDPAPPLRGLSGIWLDPARRRASLLGAGLCRFLNETHEITFPEVWNSPTLEKLWLYNLHYFDDLNAVDANTRCLWHKSLIGRWIGENPPGKGNGWEPYPASLRIVNWIKWALAGNSLEPEWLHSLAVQTRWLVKRLEIHLLGNHLFANAKALVFAGMFFEGAEASAWLEIGMKILAREIQEQVLADGGQFERSPLYHALALEDLLDLTNLTGAYADAMPGHWHGFVASWPGTVSLMRHWMALMCHPDGEISFFNDAAIGIAPSPAELEEYAGRLCLPSMDAGFRPGNPPYPPLKIGSRGGNAVDTAVHFVMEQIPPTPLFQRGVGGIYCRNDEQDLNSTALAQGEGYYVYLADSGYVRVCWGDMVALLDVAPIGPDYLPGHAHADTLSFELSLYGRRVLVNSGISCYGTGPERSRQRGTATHNTVAINGQDSSEVWGGFRVARRARPFGLRIEESENSLKVVCAHDGYTRLPGRPIHWREWHFSEGAMEIIDTIEGEFDEAMGRLFFHPGSSLCTFNGPNVANSAVHFGMEEIPPTPLFQRGVGGIYCGTTEEGILNSTVSQEGEAAGYVDGLGEIRVYWHVEGAESRMTQTAYHPEFGLDVTNQCLEMRFSRSVCKVRLTWDAPNNSHFEQNRAGLEPATTN